MKGVIQVIVMGKLKQRKLLSVLCDNQIPQMILVLRYMYALKPKTAMKLASVSRETPFLPLDDIFVTGNQ